MVSFAAFAGLADLPYQMTLREFKAAKENWGEYSCTLPTGVVPGKKWLRQEPWGQDRWGRVFYGPVAWYVGQYGPAFIGEDGEECCEIWWARVHVVEEYPGQWMAEAKKATVEALRPSP